MALISTIARPEILAQAKYHVPDAGDLIKLDAMENPYRLPEPLQHAFGERLAQVAVNRYPVPSYLQLRHKLANRFGVPDGYEVLLGNGSDELISMIAMALARPGAKVLAPAPSFVMYQMSAKFAGMEFVGVPLQDDLALNLPALLAAIAAHRPAVVYIANPNNPTGAWTDPALLVPVLDAMRDIGLVVLDEAYQPFAPGSMMEYLPRHENLVVMRTTSKLGWAGLRLGYMSAAPSVLDVFEKVRPPYNINVLTVAAAEFLLDHLEVFAEQAAKICEERERLCDALRKLPSVQVFPSSANFVLIRVPNAEQTFKKLLNHKILVKNASTMHPLLANCLRVTVSTPTENQMFMDALLTALQ